MDKFYNTTASDGQTVSKNNIVISSRLSADGKKKLEQMCKEKGFNAVYPPASQQSPQSEQSETPQKKSPEQNENMASKQHGEDVKGTFEAFHATAQGENAKATVEIVIIGE